MKNICLLIAGAILAGGCANQSSHSTFDTVTVSLLSVSEGHAELVLANNTRSRLMYEHWFGQKGKPVAYCDRGAGEIVVCATEVFLIGDEYWTHETMLAGKEKVKFKAFIKGAEKVGVKFYEPHNGWAEYYVWLDLNMPNNTLNLTPRSGAN